MKKIAVPMFLSLLPALAGCLGTQQRAEPMNPATGNAQVMTYPASVRGAYFKMGDKPFVCAEPVPDVAAGESLKAAAKIIAEAAQASAEGSTLSGKAQLEGSGERAITITALDGRSELVLVAREALYRVCEATYNQEYSEANRKELYLKAIDSIEQVANILKSAEEAKKAAADKAKAEAEAQKAKAEADAQKAKVELEKMQADALSKASDGLSGADKALFQILATACLTEHTACMAKDKDAKICGPKFDTCLAEKLKLVK